MFIQTILFLVRYMFILVSPEDDSFFEIIKLLFEDKDEDVRFFLENCFERLGKDTRITFIGHGHPTSLGLKQLTAEEFVGQLIRFGLPKQVKTIDIVACSMGNGFAEEVARLLVTKGYPDIQVNSFLNSITATPFTTIIPQADLDTKEFLLQGLTESAAVTLEEKLALSLTEEPIKGWQKELKEIRLRTNEIDGLLENKDLQPAERFKLLSEHAAISDRSNRLHRCVDEKYNSIRSKVFDSVCTEVYRGKDIRRTLDFNANFQITRQSMAELAALLDEKVPASKERIKAVTLLNTRIAELKEELYVIEQNPKLISFLFQRQASHIKYQISELTKSVKILKDPRSDIEALKLSMKHFGADKQLDTKDNAQLFIQLQKTFDHHFNRTISI